MSCTGLNLTQLGSDALNEAAGPLSASWVSPIETGHAIVLNGTSAYGNTGVGGEAKFVGVTVPQDQYAEIQWEGTSAGEFVDLTFRRDPTNVSALYEASFTHGSTSAFLVDNAGTWQSNFTLSSPLATGNRLRVCLLGTQVCVFRDTGSGFSLEHSDTLPAILPTGGSTAGQTGFNLSGAGLANNFATGSVAGTPSLSVSPLSLAFSPCPFTGIQPNSGQPYAAGKTNGNGSLTVSNSGSGTSMPFTVSSDVSWLIPSPVSGDAGSSPQTVTVTLNMNGSSLKAGIVGLADQTATGHLTINAGSAGSVVIPVQLTVSKFGI